MEPGLRHGNIVVARKHFFKIRPGDVVIANINGMQVIKRVKYINSLNKIFLNSDNTAGTSSTTWGLLPITNIVGKVIYKIGK